MADIKTSRPGRPHALQVRLSAEELRNVKKAAETVRKRSKAKKLEVSVWARAAIVDAAEAVLEPLA